MVLKIISGLKGKSCPLPSILGSLKEMHIDLSHLRPWHLLGLRSKTSGVVRTLNVFAH